MESVAKPATRSPLILVVMLLMGALVSAGLGYVAANTLRTPPSPSEPGKGLSPKPGPQGTPRQPCVDCDKPQLPSP